MDVLILVIAVLVFGLPVVAIFTARRQAGEVELLRRKVRSLEQRVDQLMLRSTAPEPGTSAAEASRVAPEAARPTEPEPPGAPEPARTEPTFEQRMRAELEPGQQAEQARTAQPPPLPARRAAHEVASDLAGTSSRDDPEQATPRADAGARSFERFLGVRGAALVGGALLALAAVLLFKHAFDQGWITPRARVWIGAVGGALAIGLGFVLQRRRIEYAPGALAGAGLVAWYASTWAAHRLYGFLSEAGASPLFVATTVVGAFASLRLASQAVAVIGLVGGFATPLLLAVEDPNAWTFFGYLVLLELGLLVVAARGGFGLLPLLAVLAATGVQVVWMFAYLAPDVFPVVLLGLGAQVLVFVALGAKDASPLASATKAAALGLTGLAVLYFAARDDLAPYLLGQGLLAAVVFAGALFLERRGALAPVVAAGLGAAATAVPFVWAFEQGGHVERGRALALALAAPLAVGLGAREWDRRSDRRSAPCMLGPRTAYTVAAVGLLALAIVAADGRPAWLLLPALLVSIAWVREGAVIPGASASGGAVVAASFLGVLLALEAGSGRGDANPMQLWSVLAGIALAFAAGWWRLGWSEPAALFLAGASLAAVLEASASSGGALWFGGFAGSAWLAGVARHGGRVLPVVAAVTYLAGAALTTEVVRGAAEQPAIVLGATVLVLLAVLVAAQARSPGLPAWVSAAAFLLGGAYLGDAQLAGAWHAPAGAWWPAAVGAACFAACALRGPRSPARWTALGGVAAPLLGIGLARMIGGPKPLFSAALAIALWVWLAARRSARPLAPLAAAGGLFAALFAALEGASSGFPAWDVPGLSLAALGLVLCTAACALGLRWLVSDETSRIVSASRAAIGIAALVLAFGTVTLVVLDLFTDGVRTRIDLDVGGTPQVALSIAWALYALALLFFGRGETRQPLRIASLVVLCLALAKLFLLDLSDLEGLYRVASIAGLAMCLLVVSLIYQRFVFRVEPGSPTAGG